MILSRATFPVLLSLFMALSLIVPAVAQTQSTMPPPEHAHVNLISASQTVAPGVPVTLIFEQLIEPEWHTYWKNPGDSGTPFTVTLTLPEGGTTSPLSFPVPERIPFPPLMNFGYSHRALYTMTVTPPAHLTSETFTIAAKMEWLVCNEICLPEGQTQTLILPVTGDSPSQNPAAAPLITDVALSHPMVTDWPAAFDEKEGQLVLTIEHAKRIYDLLKAGSTITFYPEEWGLIDHSSPQKTSFSDTSDHSFLIHIKRGDRPLDQIPMTRGVFVLEDASGQKQGYEIAAVRYDVAPGTVSNAAASVPVVATGGQEGTSPSSASIPQPGSSPSADVLDLSSLPLMILFALLGGLILNLMPCVFPILSLKILAIAKLEHHAQKQARIHGLLYAAGIIVTFWVVAGILSLLQVMGHSIGWGFQLQNPVFITFLIYLFGLIGLNLLGLFELDLTRFIPARFHAMRHGAAGSFFTGVLGAIVATPCTAPFMAAAIGYALLQPIIIGLIVFTAMGAGLALPFVILTYLPALWRFLPKPGGWMITFRHILSFPMFLTAIWLLWVLTQQTGADGMAMALLGVLSLSFMIWIIKTPAPSLPQRQVLRAVLLAILGIIVLLCLTSQSGLGQEEQDTPTTLSSGMEPQPYSPHVLDQALSTNAPVFVNMTAAWCITCKVNEKVALSSTRVENVMAEKNIIYIEGDWTRYNPDITAYLASFDRRGVPLYVYYGGKDAVTGQRPAPLVLPQLLTPDFLIKTFNP